jgi:hypothetical protein
VQSHLQKKVARATRIQGAIVLYRPGARSLFKAKISPLPAQPWWSVVLGIPLFLRTLLRLLIACSHRHQGPPITLREPIPSKLPGRSDYGPGTYITCLDCGQKFAYNYKTRQMIDFWGVRDPVALAGVRRTVGEILMPFRGLAARFGRLRIRIPSSDLGRSMHPLGTLTKGH